MRRLVVIPCSKCGYDLRASLRSPRCPECGAEVRITLNGLQLRELLRRERLELASLALQIAATVAAIIVAFAIVASVAREPDAVVFLAMPIGLLCVFDAGLLTSAAIVMQTSIGEQRRGAVDVITAFAWIAWMLALPLFCFIPAAAIVMARSLVTLAVGIGIFRAGRRMKVADLSLPRCALVAAVVAPLITNALLFAEMDGRLLPSVLSKPVLYFLIAVADAAAQLVFVVAVGPLRRAPIT